MELSKKTACLLGLTLALLVSGIGLAVVITMWKTSISTTSTTTAITSTTTSSCTTSTAPTTIIHSQNFSSNVASNAQCTPWTSFVAQLIVRPYILLTIRGTFDQIGVSVSDPTVIASIALALRTSNAYGPVTSNSRSWVVGFCGAGYELSASGTICTCTNPGYILRPCINHADYGGINSTTCSGPSQTMSVIFQY